MAQVSALCHITFIKNRTILNRIFLTPFQAAIICLLALAFAACSSGSDAPDDDRVAAKTILFFFPYSGDSNNLYNAIQQNLSDVEQAVSTQKGLGDCRLLVCVSTGQRTSVMYEIEYRGNRCLHDTLYTDYDADFTSQANIEAMLLRTRVNAPAKEYAMVVGCHGEGWLPPTTRYRAVTRFFGGSSMQYRIPVSTLANAINVSGMHMQFILFDNCYMACVENVYDLRSAADYVIASTSEILAYGLPYLRIFPLLTSVPDYEGVCREFIDFYNNYAPGGVPLPYGAIAAIDCRAVESVAEKVTEMNAAGRFDNIDTDDLQDLDAAHWTPTVYFDMGDYLAHGASTDATLAADVAELMAKLVPYKGCTARIFSEKGNTTIPIHTFSGITISDPSTNSVAVDAKTQTAWWSATH